jgi:membrane protease YdiL (CAAX protease family)
VGSTGSSADRPVASGRAAGGSLTPERTADQPPRTASDAVSWLLLALGGFVVGQLVALVVVSIVAAVLGHAGELARLQARAVQPAWLVVSELLGLWVGFVGAAVAASRWRGTGRVGRDLGLAVRPIDLVVGPLVGLASQFVLVPLLYLPLQPLIPHLDRRLQQPATHLTGGFPGATLAVIAFLTVVVVPVVEELLFRGVVLRALLRLFGPVGRVAGPVLAVAGTGVLFGLAHAESLELLGLAAFGMVLSWLAYRTGRLGPGMLAHGAFNLVAVVTTATSITLIRPG